MPGRPRTLRAAAGALDTEPAAWLPRLFVVGLAVLSLLAARRAGLRGQELFLGALLLVGLVAVGARRPGPVLVGLLVFVPLQVALLAGLYSLGAPAAAVRGMGFLKEVAVASLVVAALQAQHTRRRGEPLPWVAAAYVGLVSAFVLLPFVVQGVLYDLPLGVRLLGWRTNCLGILVLLALPALALPDVWKRRALQAVALTGVVIGAGAVWNGLLPHSFDVFARQVLHVREFQHDVLGSKEVGTFIVRTTGSGIATTRAGSFLFDPLTASFYLLLAYGVLAARLVARARPLDVAAFGLVAAGLLMTGTRSSILAALVASFVLVARAGRSSSVLRVGLVGAMLAVLVGGGLGGGFRARLDAASTGNDYSTQRHLVLSRQALEDVLSNPLGRGVGTSPAIGARYNLASRVYSENAYLQVGVETGVLGMGLFTALLFLAIRRGWRARDSTLGLAVTVAGIGLAVSGFFLHTWENFAISVTYWALVGLLMSPAATESRTSAWSAKESAQL